MTDDTITRDENEILDTIEREGPISMDMLNTVLYTYSEDDVALLVSSLKEKGRVMEVETTKEWGGITLTEQKLVAEVEDDD